MVVCGRGCERPVQSAAAEYRKIFVTKCVVKRQQKELAVRTYMLLQNLIILLW